MTSLALCLFLIYKNNIDFWKMILYPNILLNFIISRIFQVVFWNVWCHLWIWIIWLLFPICVLPFCFLLLSYLSIWYHSYNLLHISNYIYCEPFLHFRDKTKLVLEIIIFVFVYIISNYFIYHFSIVSISDIDLKFYFCCVFTWLLLDGFEFIWFLTSV